MARKIKLKDKNGNLLLPYTISDLVYVDDETLSDYLSRIINENGEYSPINITSDSVLFETHEDGFYITDNLGNIISKFNGNGMDSVLSNNIKQKIKNLLDNESNEQSVINIYDNSETVIKKYSRQTDNGNVNSNIVEKIIYLNDLSSGLNTININSEYYLHKDYFHFDLNCPYTLSDVIFDKKTLQIQFTLPNDVADVTAIIEYAIMDPSEYETVSISVKTNSSNARPTFARVKFNKLFPLVLTSDDQGLTEFVNNWAFLNGYPTQDPISYPINDRGEDYLLNITEGSFANAHTPLTFTDDTGAVRRFTMTSAIMGYDYDTTNYTKMYGRDAALMIRYGWSFAHHNASNGSNPNLISEEMDLNSIAWENIIGVGLKGMVEPDGNHLYLDAAYKSKEYSWAVFQNSTNNYPGLSKSINDWTTGKDIYGYRRKKIGGFIRTFFQNNESILFETEINNNSAGNYIIMGGTHGLVSEAKNYLKNIGDTRDDILVCSMDELWEYYHNYNYAFVDNINYNDNYLNFDVIIPKYSKHQFLGELTINIPITDCNECIISNNVIKGGWRQNSNQLTINISLETSLINYINSTFDLIENNQNSSNIDLIKRDLLYFINMLVEGTTKTTYITRYNNL